TPGYYPFTLLYDATLIIVSREGNTRQIEDGRGRTFYSYDQNGVRRSNRNNNTRILHMLRVPSHSIDTATMSELYYWQRDFADTSTQVYHDVHGPHEGSYSWSLYSAPMAVRISVEGLGFAADRISVNFLGTKQQY